eukprot:NODE_180_length_15790_cov_0.586706.p2 type:complete len:700 gc:universal NODE_180_length_15790_cov_0.586706:6612-4513(-)
MFQSIRVPPFSIQNEEIDILQPSQDHLKMVNVLLQCKTSSNEQGTLLISELQYSWLVFMCGLTGPLSGIPLYLDQLKHPFSTILYFKFSSSELKTLIVKNELLLDQPINNDKVFWNNAMSLLYVMESYPQYIQDICLDFMEQAIYDDTIPFVYLTEIAKIYSQNSLDTRLSQSYINEEKTVEHLLSNDSFEVDKLILPTQFLINKTISNLLLYSKVIRLWAVLPNINGIFEFDLTDLFLSEFEIMDKDESDWLRQITLIDYCRYLYHEAHFYLLFHLFMHSPKESKSLGKLKEFLLSVIVEVMQQEHMDMLIKTINDPKQHPLKHLQSKFNPLPIISPIVFTAFEYLLPFKMPSASHISQLLELLVKKQLQLQDTLKSIKTVLIHLAETYHSNKSNSEFSLFQYTELLMILFSFKHTPRNEMYYEVMRIYLSLILTSENQSAIDAFYVKTCQLFTTSLNNSILFVPSFDLDSSVFLTIICKLLSDKPPLQVKSIEMTWGILKDVYNTADTYFDTWVSFVQYLLDSKRLISFKYCLEPLYNINCDYKTTRIIDGCCLLSNLIINEPSIIENELKTLHHSTVIKQLILLLNHPVADVFWSVSQVLFYVFNVRKWVPHDVILEYWEAVDDNYWANILLLLSISGYKGNCRNLKKLDLKEYQTLFLHTMNDQLPDIKRNSFEVLLNVNKNTHALMALPRLTAE